MINKNLICLLLCGVLTFSLVGCTLQDDYVLVTKQNEEDVPSSEKVNDVFDSEEIQELKDKLKDSPSEIAEKMDEFDGDKERIMKEFTDKADELTDKLNQADLEGKSEDIKKEIEEVTDKLDELKDKVDDAKDRIEDKESPIEETDITDLKDQFNSYIDNLENAINRVGKH